MQWFRIDLKTFLGLGMPNQYSQTVRKQISSWFWGEKFWAKTPKPSRSLYIVLPYYMICMHAYTHAFQKTILRKPGTCPKVVVALYITPNVVVALTGVHIQ